MAKKNEVEIKIKSTFDNKGVEDAKKELAQTTRLEETSQKKTTQAKSRARSATDQLLASQTMLNKENVRAVQRGNKLNEGLIQLSYIMDDVQYGMRGILNNIPGLVMGFGASAGVAGAVSIATLAGYKFYEWLTKEDEEEKKLADARKQRNAEFVASTKEAYLELQKLNTEEQNRAINQAFIADLREVSDLYKQQTSEIKEQARLKLEELAHQKKIDTAKSSKERAEIELRYEKGEISQATKDYLLLRNNEELQDKIYNADKASRDVEIESLSKQIGEIKEAISDNSDILSTIADAESKLPTLDEAQKLFQDQAELQLRLSTIGSKEYKIFSEIATLDKRIETLREESEKGGVGAGIAKQMLLSAEGRRLSLYEEWDRLAPLKMEHQKKLREINSQIDGLSSLFASAGVGYQPTYGEEADHVSRTKEYATALNFLRKNQESAKASTDKLIESEQALTKEREQKMRESERASELNSVRKETASILIQKSNAISAKQIQKELDEEEKARSKQIEKRQKEIESERYNKQRELARSGALDISDSQRSTPKGISAIKAFEAGTAKLGESFSQTDRNVSEAEMTSIILAMQQSLMKDGQHTKDLMAFLKDAMTKLVSRINDIETQTNKELEQLKTGITRAVQQ